MEERAEFTTKDFVNGGKTYRYDFTLLTVEQAELAREAAEFKFNQMQNEPESFKQVLKSRGADWLPIVMSYLLREVKDGVVQQFDRDKAETEVEQFVKSLPVAYIDDLKACVNDFFCNIGKKQIILQLLQGEKKRSGIDILLPILQRITQESLKQSV